MVRKEPQSYPCDWWSLGVTLAYCATGLHPFRVRPTATEGAPPPPPPPPPLPAGETAPPARPKITEEELNYNTLYAPVDVRSWGVDDPALISLIDGLLQRDAAHRLGTAGGDAAHAGASALKRHLAFDGLDWELLRTAALPAPYLPDPTLVYAKDAVPPLSEDELAAPPALPPNGAAASQLEVEAPTGPPAATAAPMNMEGQSEEFLERWEYVSADYEFAEELRELVRKVPENDKMWGANDDDW